MATATKDSKTTTKPETPAAEKRVFSFDAIFSLPIPEVKQAPRANALPFKAVWTRDLQAALQGKNPAYWVPNAYWVEERGTPKEKATAAYAKGKLRDQFNQWKKEDITRAPLQLV